MVSLSRPRFNRYLAETESDRARALSLYGWNSQLSKEFYTYLQAWEICLRNRINEFLIHRYGGSWPYDAAGLGRQLARIDKERLSQARDRQERLRCRAPASLPAIVPDLSAGFWVSQLSKHYEIAHVWRRNLAQIFPHDRVLDRPAAWGICDEMLTLRNRIAHHEPIFHLPLEQRYRDLQRIVAALCPGTHAFAEAHSNFRMVWHARP
ncbi:hypothetical protein [Methylobacterium platani]|uniref:hypothetical protein n=1 Tax=Methylobacterium platani TaxID=427683 RepID=UPI0012E251C2|nr:hypothetical protein [Methylobacterium platani]